MSVELTKDIAELENIRKAATRSNVQNFLDKTIKDWRLKLDDLNAKASASKTGAESASSSKGVRRTLKKLTTYAFDESDKFVKLYYTLPGIANLSAGDITSNFTEDSFHVFCTNVNGIDYELSAVGLLHRIDASKSVAKIKSDSLLVMLKKEKESVTWKSLLKLEKKVEPKMPDIDPNADPNASLMNMMKKMYDEGDDEMKRTIRKSWYEGQQKKTEMEF